MDKKYYIYIGVTLLILLIVAFFLSAEPPIEPEEPPEQKTISNASELVSVHHSKAYNSSYEINTKIIKRLNNTVEVVERNYRHKNSKRYERISVNGRLVSETYELDGTPVRRFTGNQQLAVLENHRMSNIELLEDILLKSGYNLSGEKNYTFEQKGFRDFNTDYIKERFNFDEVNRTNLDIRVEDGVIRRIRLNIDGYYNESPYKVVITSEYDELGGDFSPPNWVSDVRDRPILSSSLQNGYLVVRHEYGPTLEEISEVRLVMTFSQKSFITKTGPETVNLRKGGEIYINVEENNINIGEGRVEIKDRKLEIMREKPPQGTLVGDIYHFTIKDSEGNVVLRKGYTK